MLRSGLDASPISQVLIEECLLGWKEYEMEVMRDYKAVSYTHLTLPTIYSV